MKLLITGGAGFIGSNFIHYWMKKYPNDYIVNLDKLTYAGNLENLTAIQSNPNYSFVKGDICDEEIVSDLMGKTDIVVHFAAESHVDRSISGPSFFIETNIVGTHVLLKHALAYKIQRFHHISTDEVFGSLDLGERHKFNENTPYNPRSPYAASKASSDHLVNAYYHTYGLPITITNCSNNYGPFQHPEKLISLTITNILEGKKIPVYGDGKNVRDWLHVEDHCRAIDLVLKKGIPGQTYLVGGQTDEVTNLEVVTKILNKLKVDDSFIKHVKDRPGHDRKYSIDWSKIRKELGWEPKYSFEKGLDQTVAWYKKNKNWWQKLKSGEFQDYYNKQYQEI